MTILIISIGSCATAPDIGLQKIESGHPAPGDGAFADKATVRELNRIVEENRYYRDQYANEPSSWQRFWTNGAFFVIGIGVGAWVVP